MITEIIPTSLYTTKLLDDELITRFNDILLNECSQKTKTHTKPNTNKIISSHIPNTSPSFPIILTKAKELLSVAGFFGLTNNARIELYNYNMSGGSIKTKFTIHADNDAYYGHNVATCIFYTQKDADIIDGNLEYYEEIIGNKWYSSFFPKYNKLGVIDTSSGTVVLMSGEQLHVPQTCSGYGQRNCIVVHVEIN